MQTASFEIICDSPERERLLAWELLEARRRERESIAAAHAKRPADRYIVIDAGFPRRLWIVYDRYEQDNVRNFAGRDQRCPWFVRETAAQKAADNLNRAEARSR